MPVFLERLKKIICISAGFTAGMLEFMMDTDSQKLFYQLIIEGTGKIVFFIMPIKKIKNLWNEKGLMQLR